jgi:hypothetical protein
MTPAHSNAARECKASGRGQGHHQERTKNISPELNLDTPSCTGFRNILIYSIINFMDNDFSGAVQYFTSL